PRSLPARRSACGISDATSSTGERAAAASPNAASALAAPGPVVSTAAPRRPLGHLPEREVVHPREPEDGGGAVHRDGVDDRPCNAPHAPSLTPPAAPVP